MLPAVSAQNLIYAWPGSNLLLDIAHFEIAAGERVFLRGASGSGKSTLLGLISGVLAPQAGDLHVLGEDMARAKSAARDRLRAADLGVIFQMFNLLPFLDVVSNVKLACQFSKARRARIDGSVEAAARALLARLGLEDEALLKRKTGALSVGQQQRVAVARALLGGPKLVIADEPTSALNSQARAQFMSLLQGEVTRTGAALLMVSHDGSLASGFDRSLDLADLMRAGADQKTPPENTAS